MFRTPIDVKCTGNAYHWQWNAMEPGAQSHLEMLPLLSCWLTSMVTNKVLLQTLLAIDTDTWSGPNTQSSLITTIS